MNSPWHILEDVPRHSAAAADWKLHLGEAFPSMREACLQKAKRKASSVQCPQVEGCTHQLKPRGDGYVAKSNDDDGDCNDFLLTADEAEVWEVNLQRLGAAIAGALKCLAKDQKLELDRTRQIASLGNAPLPILLTVQRDKDGFSDVVARLVARWPKGFILLAPTSRFCTASATDLLGRVNAGFFTLDEHVTILPSGKLNAPKSGEELFAAYLPEKREAVKESEATRIFAILQKLKSQRAGESAPLYDVFVATVLDGLSQSAAAKRCECSPAQMSKRVKQLKVEFGMPLKQLQNYAKPLLDMQTSVKGDRRRKRKPGSGPGAFADDNDDSLPPEEYQYDKGDKDD
jgi:hypothetical protein